MGSSLDLGSPYRADPVEQARSRAAVFDECSRPSAGGTGSAGDVTTSAATLSATQTTLLGPVPFGYNNEIVFAAMQAPFDEVLGKHGCGEQVVR